jgi:rRNA-processing protein FCF1
MADGSRFLIFDANALIDYCNTDRALLRKVSVCIAPICIPYPVLEEADQLTEKMCPSLKIEVVDYTLGELETVTQRCGSLSFQDRLCLELAQSRQGTCVTNDKPLRRHCDSEKISLLWGLQPLLILVRLGQLSVRAATHVAEKMQAGNHFLTQDLIDNFQIQLAEISRTRKL